MTKHHSFDMGGQKKQTKKHGRSATSSPAADPSVLFVPNVKRGPHWKCSGCSYTENWRCRTSCWICKQKASEAHVMAVMVEAVGKSLTTGGAAATHASDTANTTASDEDLRKDVEDTQRAVDAARKAKFSDDIIAVLQAELDGKRAALQAGKPLVAQLKTAERRHAEAVAKLAAHKEKTSVLQKSIDDAKNALAEHKDAANNLQTKVDKARDEVDELRQQSLAPKITHKT